MQLYSVHVVASVADTPCVLIVMKVGEGKKHRQIRITPIVPVPRRCEIEHGQCPLLRGDGWGLAV